MTLNTRRQYDLMVQRDHDHDEDQDHGFSLIELIVTVVIIGIIIAIAIPFFFGAQDSARQAAVDSAARDGQVMAQANIYQGDPTGGDLSLIETDDVVVEFANSFVLGNADTVCVRADWIGQTENYAISGPCSEEDTTVPIFDREEDDPLYTQLTYQCPTTKEGYLGIVNIGEGTRAQIWEVGDRDATIREVHYGPPADDFDLRWRARQEILRTEILEQTGSIDIANDAIDQAIEDADAEGIEQGDVGRYSIDATIENTSELVEMEAETRYVVRFDGEIETFSAPGHRTQTNDENSLADCLVSIDHFGDDINLKNIVYLGGENLTSVPDSIPSSVVSLRGAFENASSFNNRNVSSWNVDNVYSLRSTFYRAASFNRPLDGWDVSNVVNAEMMFQEASSFNQDLDSWNVTNITDMRNMFREASNFNGDVSGWNVSNVTDMHRMFDHAYDFNQDISSWVVDLVEDYGNFDRETALEEHHRPDFGSGS